MTPIDLVALDARVARANASLLRGGDDPLADYRDVSGKNAYDALKEHDPGPIHAPHRDALLRWIAFFTDARIGWDLALEESKREKAEDPALIDARKDIVISKTWAEAHDALITAPNAVELEKAFVRLDELAAPIAAVRRERRSRSFEIARRLGVNEASPTELARSVLDATEPLARDWLKRVGATPAHVIESSYAKDAIEGWPARLTSRWLEDAFKTIAPRTPHNVVMPEARGGASFLRATADWGFALRLGSTAKSLPFALSRDPAPTEAHLYGDLLALAVSSRPFQRRKLDLPARTAEAQERILARTLFVTLRELAALVQLGQAETVSADEVEETSARIFGRPFPRAIGMVWAHGGIGGDKRADAGPRLVAALRAFALREDLVAKHDEDWFDNPRAAQRLGHIAAGPVWQEEKPEIAIASRVARVFEEALG